MPCGKMNYGKCYKKIGRLAYLNKQEKPNNTKDYGSQDARSRAIRRRVGRFSTNGQNKNYGPLFGLKKTMFDKSCKGKNTVYYTANSGDASDVTYWRKNYGGSKNLTVSGKNCNSTNCVSNNDTNGSIDGSKETLNLSRGQFMSYIIQTIFGDSQNNTIIAVTNQPSDNKTDTLGNLLQTLLSETNIGQSLDISSSINGIDISIKPGSKDS